MLISASLIGDAVVILTFFHYGSRLEPGASQVDLDLADLNLGFRFLFRELHFFLKIDTSIKSYLTNRPRARMDYEAIAHEVVGRMGYSNSLSMRPRGLIVLV